MNKYFIATHFHLVYFWPYMSSNRDTGEDSATDENDQLVSLNHS